MMKITAILLSNLILFQSLNIDLDFFPKIKVLLEHAQYHQDKYGDTFLEFLSEHYGDKELSSNTEHKEHKDLPFKKSSKTCNHLISDFSFNIIVFKLKSKMVINTKPNYFYKDSFSLHEKHSIFQPPKHS